MAKKHTCHYWTDLEGNKHETEAAAEAADAAIRKTQEDKERAKLFTPILDKIWDKTSVFAARWLDNDTLAEMSDLYEHFCKAKRSEWGNKLTTAARKDLEAVLPMLFLDQNFFEIQSCIYREFYESSTFWLKVSNNNGLLSLTKFEKKTQRTGVRMCDACSHVAEVILLGSDKTRVWAHDIAQGAECLNAMLDWQWEDSYVKTKPYDWISDLESLDLSRYEIVDRSIMLKRK